MIKLNVGDVLVHSIGCGCDSFWQITQKTDKTVTARRLEEKIVNRNIKAQSFDILPIKNKFCKPEIHDKYLGGYKEGKCRFKKVDKNIQKLKVTADQIGPSKRMIWWSKWDGKQQDQYSP